MQAFEYKNGTLHAENASVSSIVKQYGSPCYIYSRKAFETQYLAYDEALAGQPHMVCYAVKANSNIAVLNVLARLGAGFDIVSLGELERVLAAGGDPSRIVFSGVAKQPAEMIRAMEVGVHCFNIESEAELERLNDVAAKEGKVASISLRVNPDVDAKTHPYISTGLKDNKFGIDINEALRVYKKASLMNNVKIKGVDCHIGSQLTEVQPFLDALDRVLLLIDELANAGITIEHLDLGGGLGVVYKDETPPTPASYIKALTDKLGDRKLTLLFEPGRSISANAGIFATTVEFIKPTEFKNFAIIDGAMNDLIRPALYQAWQDIVPVQQTPSEGVESQTYDIVGPICETGDFLGKDRELAIEAGDILAVKSAGAYGFTMASNYNSRNRVAEIMVDGDETHLIRRRETVEEQFASETLLP
jgi:diaminopimelate decarboxylase